MKKVWKNIGILAVILILVLLIGAIVYNLQIVETVISEEKEYYAPEYNSEYITVNTIELENSEISNEYQFVFIADLQASIIDENEEDEEDEQIRTSLEDRRNHFLALNENGTTPELIFNEIINYTNNKNADALLLVGDILDSPSNSNINFLKSNLANLQTDYLYTFGNHDWTFLWDYQTDETWQTYSPKFSEFMDDTEVSYLEYEDLIVLAINDGREQIEESAIEKIKEVLEKGKPTLVMLHIPIATEYIVEQTLEIRDEVYAIGGEYGIEANEYTEEAINLILSDEYNVFYIIAGHTHFEVQDTVNGITEYVTAPAYDGTVNLIKINSN